MAISGWGRILVQDFKDKLEEGKKNPQILDKWGSAVPIAVDKGVTAATGNPAFGKAAHAATSATMMADKPTRRKAANVTRAGILAFTPIGIIRDVYVMLRGGPK